MSKPVVRLVLWLAMMAAVLMISILSSDLSRAPSTNIFDLLPSTEQDPAAAAATNQLTQELGRWVTFVVSGDNRSTVRVAALQLDRSLRETGSFADVVTQISDSFEQDTTAFYFPWRFGLLNESLIGLPEQELGERLVNDALAYLASPLGLVGSEQLLGDPLFILPSYFQSLSNRKHALQMDEGMFVCLRDGQYHVFISALLAADNFSLASQNHIVLGIQQATEQLSLQYQTVDVLHSGMIFYMKAGADSARSEVSTIGVGSILGVLLLLLVAFRAVTPLVLCLLSIGAGVLSGYLLTIVVFGQVHMITLVFGASLIGVSIDYAFHYTTEWLRQGAQWQPLQGLKHIMPGITLGLITSVLGYIPMIATPFPGLQQIAVFSSTGLIFAWLTVVLVYPVVLTRLPRSHAETRWPLPVVDKVLWLWQVPFAGQRKTLVMGCLLMCSLGAFWLHSSDDIRQLQNRPPELVSADARQAEITGYSQDNRFFLVRGASPEQLLQRVERLSTVLDDQVQQKQLSGYQAVTDVLPSLARQQSSYQQLSKIYQGQLPMLWQKLGVPEAAQISAKERFQQRDGEWLTPELWFDSPLASLYDNLWLGEHGRDYFSAVLLQNLTAQWPPESLVALDGVTFVDRTSEVSGLFGRYRILMSGLLVVAYAIIAALLSVRYGVSGMVRVITPPLVSVGLTLSVLAATGQVINLFHILALLMVLGIGIDYTLFFHEAGSERRYTLMAITLSALTTLLSFGLLALSQTAAISGFGFTVLIGISCCYLLSPFAMPEVNDESR